MCCPGPGALLPQVNGEGVFRYANSKWFIQALQTLAATGIHGVAVDIWVRAGVLAGCLWLDAVAGCLWVGACGGVPPPPPGWVPLAGCLVLGVWG